MMIVNNDVIIPCVAGQFFEGRPSASASRYSTAKSSSPALRGSSSKLQLTQSKADGIFQVIIPCVAGQFFEASNQPRVIDVTVLVIIPCVAGQFFEGGVVNVALEMANLSSSSPALRGSSSKIYVL